jgi:hypothetical protein
VFIKGGQMNPLSPFLFFKTNFNIIVPSIPTSCKLSLSFPLAYRNPGCISLLPHTIQYPVYIILIVLINLKNFGGSTNQEFPTAFSYFIPFKALPTGNDTDLKDFISCKYVFKVI